MGAFAVVFCLLIVLSRAETPLQVMSFNIRYGTAADKQNAWPQRKEIVAGVIRQYDPDIVGTQECLDFQAEYLVAELPRYRWFGVGRESDGGGEHMAVLYKKDVLAPIESGNFWLSETPDTPGTSSWNSACNRMVTWAKFYHLETKAFFYYFNTHLDHQSEPARQGGARVLLSRLSQLASGTPIVVTGDFNALAEKSETYSILTGGGLSDAWSTAQERAGPVATWSGFEDPREGSDRRIDWILTRGPVVVHRCETVTYNREGRYPSDHFPVFAKLTLIEDVP
jgi:endonuclease/exonuclease/phosphatase family metal-dependent hydrolase